eukprot:m.110249 g.110249  ORF g.110249 m.110249 type:complete len:313 (-) comp13393_c0_seq1:321-1259(-)
MPCHSLLNFVASLILSTFFKFPRTPHFSLLSLPAVLLSCTAPQTFAFVVLNCSSYCFLDVFCRHITAGYATTWHTTAFSATTTAAMLAHSQAMHKQGSELLKALRSVEAELKATITQSKRKLEALETAEKTPVVVDEVLHLACLISCQHTTFAPSLAPPSRHFSPYPTTALLKAGLLPVLAADPLPKAKTIEDAAGDEQAMDAGSDSEQSDVDSMQAERETVGGTSYTRDETATVHSTTIADDALTNDQSTVNGQSELGGQSMGEGEGEEGQSVGAESASAGTIEENGVAVDGRGYVPFSLLGSDDEDSDED